MISSTRKEEILNTRFIHASDIHLGAQQFRNIHLAYDYFNIFREILQIAINQRADFIILGGDVFTSQELIPELFLYLIQILQKFKSDTKNSIPIIAIEGNHDIRRFFRNFLLDQKQSLLRILAQLDLIVLLDGINDHDDNISFLPYNHSTHKGGSFQVKNILIYGTRFLGKKFEQTFPKMYNQIPEKSKDVFQILLQHFGIEGQMNNVPGEKFEKIQMMQQKINYLALGHYHLGFSIINWIYNPGCPHAVSSQEYSFNRGIYLVDVIKKESNFSHHVQYLKLANRKIKWVTVNVPVSLPAKEDMFLFILNAVKENLKIQELNFSLSSMENPNVQLVLKGYKPKNWKIDERELISYLLKKINIVNLNVFQKFCEFTFTLDHFILKNINY